ncbi:uncharacterized protein LOC114428750 isoform X2 [Parambassis ranga]|uniref:Uncharacterized protein LOC114428750 isoform X2 n=1 Tax=Parambassis ranga TaxID=210632 RepID=A0A6P7HCK0_9TELE|nr:uncharacterized protein LOC114428750 isoform X2 [Parambassis ranga]
MVQSGHIQMCVFWILLLQFAAVSSQTSSYFTVRVGDDVTLPCENVIKPQPSCGSTTWIYSTRKQSGTEELVNLGKIRESSTSDRLSLTADCSLLIERVTEQDAGLYSCRQFISGQQGSDHAVHLSVIHITEQTHTDKVTLTCSVFTYEGCRHTVEWLIQSTRNTEISQSTCSSSVSIDSDRKDESFTCEVTDNNNNKVLLCSSEPQTSCERQPSVDKTKTSTTLATTPSTQMTKNNKQMDENFNKTATSDPSTQSHCWWRLMVGSVGVAALISAVVVVNIWTRAKVRKSETDENKVCSDEEDAL